MPTQIQIRRGTASSWTSTNPILALGEMGLETDTRKTKFGDGITTWNLLAYAAGGTGGTTNASDITSGTLALAYGGTGSGTAAGARTALGVDLAKQFRVSNYGAKADGVTLYDGVWTGTTGFSSATAAFTAADVGKSIVLQSSHSARQVLTIDSVTNPTTVVLSGNTTGTSAGYTPRITTYGTDNTQAIRDAITAMSPAGGELIFDGGVYLITGVPTDTSTINTIFKIPQPATSSSVAANFKFTGVGTPQHTTFNPNQRPCVTNTVLYFTNKTVSGSNASLFAVTGMNFMDSGVPANSYWGSLPVMTTFENMTIRQPAVPAMHGLQFHLGGGLSVKNVRCDSDVQYHSTAFPWSAPTSSVAAMIPPSKMSAYYHIIEDVSITGYGQAIRITDSLRLDHVVIEACEVALANSVGSNGTTPINATNGMSAGQIFVNRCRVPIQATIRLNIDFLNIETNNISGGDNITPSWCTTANEDGWVIDNNAGLISGSINAFSVLSGEGPIPTRVRTPYNGASRLRVFDVYTQRTIGSNEQESISIAASASAPVTGPTLTRSGATGTATYGYKVAYIMADGSVIVGPEVTISSMANTLTTTDKVVFSAVPLVAGSYSYRIYRTSSTGSPATLGLIESDYGPTKTGSIYSYADTGAVAGGGEIPITTAGTITANRAKLTSTPVFANDAAAATGGLTVGQVYVTSGGVLMLKQ